MSGKKKSALQRTAGVQARTAPGRVVESTENTDGHGHNHGRGEETEGDFRFQESSDPAGVLPRIVTPNVPSKHAYHIRRANRATPIPHSTIRTIRLRFQPNASSTQISCVRSKTVISMVFITPSTPTSTASREVPQLMACTMRKALAVADIISGGHRARHLDHLVDLVAQSPAPSRESAEERPRTSMTLILPTLPVSSW